ncbi:MAG: hypothetical protein L0191_07750 [Acidobacteria bacterium]|nr:hypothetical protein [Acidobacteriota bacterium]
MRRTLFRLLFLLLTILSACAARAPAPGPGAALPPTQVDQSPEEALRARATQFWEARVKSDLVTQHGFLEPKAREQMTLTAFIRSRSAVVYLAYEIEGVEVAADQGRVLAKTKFRVALPQAERFGPWTQPAITRWVREGGAWYLKGSQDDAGQALTTGSTKP